MVEILETYDFGVGRPALLDKSTWDEWLDGRVRRLTMEVDIPHNTVHSFQTVARKEAAKRNIKVSTKIEGKGKFVVLQARLDGDA